MAETLFQDSWVENNFNDVDLKDKRLNKRLVEMTKKMARLPEASIPKQLESWSEIKAGYRFLSHKHVTHKRIQQGHWDLVKNTAIEEGKKQVILFIQDGSELDYTSLEATEGIGPIGNHNNSGLMIHSCLAVKYHETNPIVLGLAHQQVWERQNISLCRSETKSQRNKRGDKESKTWLSALRGVGACPKECKWISVGDRGNDIYEFIEGGKKLGWEMLIRACQNRKIEVNGQEQYLMEWARSLPLMGKTSIEIRKKGDSKKRYLDMSVAWGKVSCKAPQRLGKGKMMEIYVVRCWNEEEDIDWVLLTTIPVTSFDEAVEKVNWYACRWVIEEYHKCLKTGCKIEKRQLETSKGLKAILGIFGILSILMLHLRNLARDENCKTLAEECVPETLIKIIAKRYDLDLKMSIREFWRHVAKLGGFIGRKSDGEPGWQTLWGGWLRLLDMCWVAECLKSS